VQAGLVGGELPGVHSRYAVIHVCACSACSALTIGFDRFAMIGLKVRPGTAREVCQRLGEFPETSYVIMTAGQYDVMAEVICRDTRHFTDLVNERMHQIDGVTCTEPFFVLEVHKLAYGWGVGRAMTAQSRS
jgi:Lrp/AsnC family transcriptional regulator, regulator for asnA, asnC and gidA